jgi:hypothetical protein
MLERGGENEPAAKLQEPELTARRIRVVKARQALGHDIDRRWRIGRALCLRGIRLRIERKREEKRSDRPAAEPNGSQPRRHR